MKKSILDIVHSTAKDLRKAGLITQKTMNEFDEVCFPKVRDFKPEQIKRLRRRNKVSQPVFAICLNIKASTVKKWESGENHPSGAALKLLNLIDKNGLEAVL